MAKWKEVSAYTGEEIEEDAPTNSAGSGAVDMNPTGMKKKKKSLLDARTKAYKEHKAKLEAARQKRMSEKKSKFVEKVKESLDDFNRESFLAEDNVDVLKSIVKSKQAKPVKFKDGSMKCDFYTASAMVQVLDKVNATNKEKLTKMINGTKKSFLQAQNAVMKLGFKK
jgi:hypothetical protein|tara:strand:- start:61 stop:564 length:504 start_codon:yes stop_codon:yes gene_type:complete